MIHEIKISAQPVLDPLKGLKLRWRILINDKELCYDYIIPKEELVSRSVFNYVFETARQKLERIIFLEEPVSDFNEAVKK